MLFRSDRKSTRLNSSHTIISYAVFCLKKKQREPKKQKKPLSTRLNHHSVTRRRGVVSGSPSVASWVRGALSSFLLYVFFFFFKGRPPPKSPPLPPPPPLPA